MIAFWNKLRGNPFFVTAWTLFAGALGSQLYIAQQDGHLDFTAGSWEKMLIAAAGTTAISLLHLYTPAPGTPPVVTTTTVTTPEVPATSVTTIK